jgi:hypothetical protein
LVATIAQRIGTDGASFAPSLRMENDNTDTPGNHRDVRTGDQPERALPVTAEVGGEGGSYADPTTQVATFRERLDRNEGHGGDGPVANDVANYAINRAEIARGGVGSGPEPAHGMIRYPSEAPSSAATSVAPAAVRRNALNWRGGVIGAVAGLAGAALVGGLSGRRSRRRS